MTFSVSPAAAPACAPDHPHPKATKILTAAARLLTSLERGHALDAHLLRDDGEVVGPAAVAHSPLGGK
jgi:hypothetical protein